MRRRLYRVIIAGLLGRAWAQKKPTWLGLAGAVILFRLADARAAKAGRRAKSVRS